MLLATERDIRRPIGPPYWMTTISLSYDTLNYPSLPLVEEWRQNAGQPRGQHQLDEDQQKGSRRAKPSRAVSP